MRRVFPGATLMAGIFFLGIYVGRGTSTTNSPLVHEDTGCFDSARKAMAAADNALAAAAKSDALTRECLAMLRQDDAQRR